MLVRCCVVVGVFLGASFGAGCQWPLCDACPDGARCIEGRCILETDAGECEVKCGTRSCGPDPECGASCGTCSHGFRCSESGVCEAGLPWVQTASSTVRSVGLAIAVGPDGRYYVAGRFTDQARFGSSTLDSLDTTESDGFVARVEPDGGYYFVDDIGSSGEDIVYGVAVDSASGVLVTGLFSDTLYTTAGFTDTSGGKDGFLLKMTNYGSASWALPIGGAGVDVGAGIALDGEGGAYVVGAFEGTASAGLKSVGMTSRGGWDLFVVKFTGSSVFEAPVQWVMTGGSAVEDDIATGAAVGPGGNLYVVAKFAGSATFGGKTLTGDGEADVAVLKLSPGGKVLWAWSAGGPLGDWVNSVAVDKAGATVFAGCFQGKARFGDQSLTSAGKRDIFVAKLSATGDLLWARSFGGTGDDCANGIAVAPDGAVFVAGFFEGQVGFGQLDLTSRGGADIFVAKLAPTGEASWATSAGGKCTDEAVAVAVGTDGLPCVTGHFCDTVFFDGIEKTATSQDLFIWHLAAP
jgi:hypothetical protein